MTDLTPASEGQVTVIERMDRAEGARLQVLEQSIEQVVGEARRKAADALLEIRDRRLYRATHTSFEDYVVDRWGFSKSTAYRWIEAAQAKAQITETAGQDVPPRDTSADEPVAEAPSIEPEPPRIEAEVPLSEPEGTVTVVEPAPSDPSGWEYAETPPVAPEAPVVARKLTKGQEMAREHLGQLLALLRVLDPEKLARNATPAERDEVANFALPFVVVTEVGGGARPKAKRGPKGLDPATGERCVHPIGRRVGNACAICFEVIGGK